LTTSEFNFVEDRINTEIKEFDENHAKRKSKIKLEEFKREDLLSIKKGAI